MLASVLLGRVARTRRVLFRHAEPWLTALMRPSKQYCVSRVPTSSSECCAPQDAEVAPLRTLREIGIGSLCLDVAPADRSESDRHNPAGRKRRESAKPRRIADSTDSSLFAIPITRIAGNMALLCLLRAGTYATRLDSRRRMPPLPHGRSLGPSHPHFANPSVSPSRYWTYIDP